MNLVMDKVAHGPECFRVLLFVLSVTLEKCSKCIDHHVRQPQASIPEGPFSLLIKKKLGRQCTVRIPYIIVSLSHNVYISSAMLIVGYHVTLTEYFAAIESRQ